jgi:hypothetical protein
LAVTCLRVYTHRFEAARNPRATNHEENRCQNEFGS